MIHRKEKLAILPGNLILDLEDVIGLYPYDKDKHEIKILTKSQGIIVIDNLHYYDKDITMAGTWLQLAIALTGAELDLNASGLEVDGEKIIGVAKALKTQVRLKGE
jgi:hypothetical protein